MRRRNSMTGHSASIASVAREKDRWGDRGNARTEAAPPSKAGPKRLGQRQIMLEAVRAKFTQQQSQRCLRGFIAIPQEVGEHSADSHNRLPAGGLRNLVSPSQLGLARRVPAAFDRR